MRLFFCSLLCWACMTAATVGRDIFVDNAAGDDRSTGAQSHSAIQLGGPVRSISKALRLAAAGDRIVIAPNAESYRESLTLFGTRHSGNDLGPLIIEGNGAILEGSDDVPPDAWEHFRGDVFRFRPPRMSHQQLFVGGRPAVRRPTVSDRAPPPLAPLEWCLVDQYIYFRVEQGRIPPLYPLSCAARETGITLLRVENVAISDLVVQGFRLDGVNAHDGVRNARLLNVTSRGNGRSGITVGGSSVVDIRDCLVGDNAEAQLRTEGFSRTHVHDSQLLDNTAPPLVIDGGQVWIDGKPVDARAAAALDIRRNGKPKAPSP